MGIIRKDLEKLGFREVKEDGVNYFEFVFNKKDYENSSALVTTDVQDSTKDYEDVYNVYLLGVNPSKFLTLNQVETLIEIYNEGE